MRYFYVLFMFAHKIRLLKCLSSTVDLYIIVCLDSGYVSTSDMMNIDNRAVQPERNTS